jgi:N-acyl-D-amino-acid deacylase
MQLIVRDVLIVDGSGEKAFQGDIGIEEGRFVYVGPRCEEKGETEIQGSGLVAAPGFVDIHSHSDYYLLVNPLAESKVRQGVTTEIGGNCGYSAAPVFGKVSEERREIYKKLFDLDLPWESVAEYFSHLSRQKMSVNFGLLVGHNTVRASVMYGSDQEPTQEELSRMMKVVRQGIEEGALGLSTGLIYAPACFSGLSEMVALTESVREAGGIFAVHMRNEGNRLLEAVDEVIGVAEKAKIPLQISHLKTSGERNWQKLDDLFKRIEAAQDRGVDITSDRYPYTASNTGLSAVLPDWAFEGGTGRIMERLKDKGARDRIRKEIALEHPEDGYFEKIMIAAVTRPEHHGYAGRNVKDCADHEGKDPVDFICDLLVLEQNMVDAIYFTMSPENLRRIVKKPYVMIGSDSGAKTVDGPLGEGNPHPRAYGTFPRVLQQFVREEGLLTLEEAIRKMTFDPLNRVGVHDRGLIKQGFAADLVLFDLNEVRDSATYEAPKKYPEGIKRVLVNGEIVVQEGEHTGKRPGTILKRSSR